MGLIDRVLLIALTVGLAGCGTIYSQVQPTVSAKTFTLKHDQLPQYGLAFLTPSTVTGQEQDKQTLALIVAETLTTGLPAVHITTLPESLAAVNRTGLTDDYRQMLDHYRETGVFPRAELQRVGRSIGVRYLAQLKLASFGQDVRERLGILGLRMLQTLNAHVRLYLEIWDSEEGQIAWEGVAEVAYSYDSGGEIPVTFHTVVEEATRQLIARLP
jgi:hypothetical protein